LGFSYNRKNNPAESAVVAGSCSCATTAHVRFAPTPRRRDSPGRPAGRGDVSPAGSATRESIPVHRALKAVAFHLSAGRASPFVLSRRTCSIINASPPRQGRPPVSVTRWWCVERWTTPRCLEWDAMGPLVVYPAAKIYTKLGFSKQNFFE